MERNRFLTATATMIFVTLLGGRVIEGQQMPPLNIMPAPASVQITAGNLRVDSSFRAAISGRTDARLISGSERFLRQLAKQTALPISLKLGSTPQATLVIQAERDSKPVQELGEDETYTLEITESGAKLSAPTTLGALHGLQTFLQLVAVGPEGFQAAALRIDDKPRFPWRGLMIDTGRHFIPLEVLRRNIDGMEAVKMNVFHWHLSENQGFRAESRKFPKLHGAGSEGMYYSQEEIKGLIAYAHERGIRVVPEFDMPGHSTAWFVGHPELASGHGPYEIEKHWGVFDPAMDPTNEKTYKFLDQFIDEMAKIFPDHFFHVGGDEVNGKEWDANPMIQEFIRAHGLKGNAGLQLYFNKRLQAIVTRHGKSMIGWDEVLDPTLPKDIMIQSWRGPESLSAAAKQGYRGILSNGYYLDLGWTAARHYAMDPLSGAAANLSPEEKQRILGGESCMWTEYSNSENIDSRIWPRNAAIAERLWSPEEVRDPASMYARLDKITAQLEWLGLTHRSYYGKMLRRIAGDASDEEYSALKSLADIAEPVKDYGRDEDISAPASSATPLNGMVDAVALESNAGRIFNERVDRFISSGCKDPDAEAWIRAQLLLWRDSAPRLHSLSQKSFLAKGAALRSQDLAAMAAIGLAALDAAAHGDATDEAWKAQRIVALQESAKPRGQLLLVPASGIQKLVENVAPGGSCATPHP